MQFVDQAIEDYALKKSTLPGAVPAELAAFTHRCEEMSQMLVGEMVGSFLGLLIRVTGARRDFGGGDFQWL